MSPVATSDAAFRGGACPTPECTIAYTGNYTTSVDASELSSISLVRKHLAVIVEYPVPQAIERQSATLVKGHPPLPRGGLA